jgi:putative NADH-flavin reductase
VRVVVFGATGRTGRPLVRRALGAGHEVVAFARTPSALDDLVAALDDGHRERLTVVEGDVLDADAVATAVGGADAVTNVLGHADGSPDDVLERGGRHVLDAMCDRGVDRYVVLTGAGVRTDRDPGQSIGSRVMGGLLGLVAADLLADSEAHVDDVRASGLDWTVLRAPRLTDGEATGSYELGYLDLGLGATLSRADAAAAMLDVLEAEPGSDGAWVGELPHVTGR